MSPEEAARARELSSWGFEQTQQAQMQATQHAIEVTLMNAAAIQMEAAAVLMTAPIVPPGLAPTPTP
jgi:Na+/melibiose symporter-like transporter